MHNLYIIAGCNGAGKTKVFIKAFPQTLNRTVFVNANFIAKGMSLFHPEIVAFEAGRIMLNRMNYLLEKGEDFAFETTLSARSYVSFIKKAQEKGYKTTLVFVWLKSIELAKQRVKERVIKGGHNIEPNVIERRYIAGLKNLFELYLPISDKWFVFDNSEDFPVSVAEGSKSEVLQIKNDILWLKIQKYKDER